MAVLVYEKPASHFDGAQSEKYDPVNKNRSEHHVTHVNRFVCDTLGKARKNKLDGGGDCRTKHIEKQQLFVRLVIRYKFLYIA